MYINEAETEKEERTDNAGLVIDSLMDRHHYNFEKVTKLVYLGVTVIRYYDEDGYINIKLLKGRRAAGSFLNTLRSNNIYRKSKIIM